MAVLGVICEYDPFHTGHAYHLAAARRAVGEDAVVVCAMSGNWVQRGECAVTDKWRRAGWAVAGGADLVVELPTVWAVSSAETFARGGVALLAAAGVDTLTFGVETSEPATLFHLAEALNSPAYPAALRDRLGSGLPYAAARQRAAAQLVGEAAAGLLEKPNNNLAVEYLRAKPAAMGALPIFRQSVHDGPLGEGFPSASALRRLLRAGETAACAPYLPSPWSGPVCRMERGERAVLAALRGMDPAALAAIPDSGDGLAQRLWAAAQEAGSLETLYAGAKSRHLTHARVRRVTLWAFLGLDSASRPAAPTYLRVLAMSRRGRRHLAGLKGRCPLPIITKPAQHKALLAQEARLTDLYGLFQDVIPPAGWEYRSSPVLLP